MATNLWLEQFKQCSETAQDPNRLAELLTLDINDPQVSSLQNDILDNSRDVSATVEAINLHDGDWPGLVGLAQAYLRLCESVDPNDLAGSFDLYVDVFTSLQAAFANTRGAVLGVALSRCSRTIVSLSLLLDSQLSPAEMIRTSYIASILLKMFNSIRGEKIDPSMMDGSVPTKKDHILFVATLLCRAYFKLGKPSSCANVFSNIHTANIKFSRYALSQRVEYRYYLGRYYVFKNQFGNAYRHLQWAFDRCLSSSKNKRLILIYLIPVALILGKLPTMPLLELYGLDSIYSPLVNALKSANYQQFMAHVDSQPYRDWFLRRGLHVALRTRTIVVLHRQVVSKVWRLTGQKTVIKFDHVRRALVLSMGSHEDAVLMLDNDPDNEKLEAIFVSLISQGYLKAKVFSRNRVLRLPPQGAIPLMVDVHKIAGPEGLVLTGHEKWMDQ